MVTVLFIAALVAAYMWARAWTSDLLAKASADAAEHYKEVYFAMASDNVDLRVKLQDSQEAYSRLIGQRVQGWATSTVTRH